MSNHNRNELAANTIDGVYVCENAASRNECESGEVLQDMDFYDALSDCPDGVTLYGNVSDELAQRIEEEYGIR